MAYFERADERDQMVLCNICNVKCAERSILVHKGKCSERHAKKFSSGDLIMCQYDRTHIVPRGQLEIHLEFCSKYQNKLVGEYQLACKAATSGTLTESITATSEPKEPIIITDPDWVGDLTRETFSLKFSNMKL